MLLLTVLRWVIAWIFGSGKTKTGGKRQVPNQPRRMVKDPQCGMYVAPELALEMRNGKGSLYFCSNECREKYAKAQLKG